MDRQGERENLLNRTTNLCCVITVLTEFPVNNFPALCFPSKTIQHF